MSARGYRRNFEPFKILTDQQVEAIHRGSLRILHSTGVRFENERALKLLHQHGCRVDFEQRRVRFPPALVEECLRMCPSCFPLKGRRPEYDLFIGGDTQYYAPMPGMRTIDIDTWEPKTPTIQDNHDAVKVLASLDNVHLLPSYTPYCELEGVAPAMLLPTSTWSQMKYLRKPVRIGQAVDSHIWGLKMAEVVDVGVFAAMESAPPLTWYGDALDCAYDVAQAGHPVEVGCGAVLGATGPATLAGGLVAANAEVMSGIVFVQAVRPRTPILANDFVFPQNMRTGAPGFGRIGVALFQVMFNQMWRGKYDIPTMHGGTGPGVSKRIDYQLGYEKGIGNVLTAISGASVINFVGGLTGELSYHPVLSVLDNDMGGAIGRFLEGVEVSHETLALDLIEKVGPIPGFFLGEEHTRKWWAREQFVPRASDQLTHLEWQMSGRKSALDYAKEITAQLLQNYMHDLPEDQEAELDRILEEARDYYRKKDLL